MQENNGIQQICGQTIPYTSLPKINDKYFKIEPVDKPVRYVYLKEKVVENALRGVSTDTKYTFNELKNITGLNDVQLRRLLSQYHHEGKVERYLEKNVKKSGKKKVIVRSYVYVFNDTTPEPIINSETNFDKYKVRYIQNPKLMECLEDMDNCNYYIEDIQVRIACLYLASVTYASCVSIDRESPTTFYLNLRGNIYLFESFFDKRRELEIANDMIRGVMYYLEALAGEYEKNPQKAIPDIGGFICDFQEIPGLPVIGDRLFPIYAGVDIPFAESGCKLPDKVGVFDEIHVESKEFGIDECVKYSA